MPFNLFKSKGGNKKSGTSSTNGNVNVKPQWVDSWLRTRVDPEEVVELLHGCTQELKLRALDIPFLLLPFRPSSDPSAAKSFVRNYFVPPNDRPKMKGEVLMNELRMTEVMVLIGVMKWCWARLPGGVVSWEAYRMFKIGERDSKYARDAFRTFIPISVETDARVAIINDFFDLLAALAAHGKTNGLGGHKLSRFAGWWAFEHYDTGKGFEAGYKAWAAAADATCHLFFAYLRSGSPERGKTNGVLDLPRSLQQLVDTTDYPPLSTLLANDTTKVVMVVDVVSPTPYALLRRAKNFEYRDDDRALQRFADYEDPVDALTEECRRVLRAISTTNQSQVSDAKTSTSLVDPSWSRFEDIGFSSVLDDIGEEDKGGPFSFSNASTPGFTPVNRSPTINLARPTTPSWADFLSSGFAPENGKPVLLPPDKMLPPIDAEPRGQSSRSHRRALDTGVTLEPGELASITRVNLDDSFWWVWISSLAGEEPTSRKACFGRCALIETTIVGGSWMVMEEQVKGAAPEPTQGAYIAEKKSFLGFTKRGRLSRRKSAIKKSPLNSSGPSRSELDPASTTNLPPDQQAKIQRAALELANKAKAEEAAKNGHNRRGRFDDPESRANSIFTLGPQIKAEVSPALQWAKQYDKNAIRAQYLGNDLAGKGSSDLLSLPADRLTAQRSTSTLSESVKDKDLPTIPGEPALPLGQKHEIQIESMGTTAQSARASADPGVEIAPRPVSKTDAHLPTTAVESTPLPTQPAAPITNEPSLEAARIPLPPATPTPEVVEALPEVTRETNVVRPASKAGSNRRQSSSPEQSRKKSFQTDSNSTQRPNGIRRLFGTRRKSRDESAAPPPPPVANPAVAAARLALQSKINPPQPTPAQNNFAKYKGVRTPIAAATAVATVPEPARAPEQSPQAVEEEVRQVAPELEAAPVPPPKELEPSPHLAEPEHQPPKLRRDEEFDNLSRVDTQEREHADQEFSRFDQGPLLEQPAVFPVDYPRENGVTEATEHQLKHQSVYSAVTMPAEDTDDDEDDDDNTNEQNELTQEVSPNDRWAQIRRNAAERAARFPDDDRENRSRRETKTDDGETSGEETIESRVARIKARVAELTGNMEGVRR